jgi:ribonuclease HI
MSIIIFTDGSCIAGTDKCGYGIHFPNKEYEDISKKFNRLPQTSQRAELYAIYKAINKISKKDKNMDMHIFTDSEYSIKSITLWIKKWKQNNWKTANNKDVLNQDIIKNIDNIINEHIGKIEFTHVRSHTNKKDYESIHNSIADSLAKNGANS